ncbi:copper chaperone PCu(A)C [Andreprevotia chitinilytica]|uniref:copper chaperone PCu(A)C n=1 Tax=Andreprevotia chitinilytica TaxID=396808 RepID=UPI00055036B0|nr:copper chaperone PCu(A)C [Andreprevotia chitinilytica]
MLIRKLLLVAALGCTALMASAHEYTAGDLFVHHPWARATAPGAKNGGVFLLVKNKGNQPDQLIGAQTDVAEQAGLHEMKMDNGVMKMGPVPAVEVPAKGEVELKPGSYHVMLVNLKAPLKAGDKFPLTLTFKRAGQVKVEVKVEAMGAKAEEMHQHPQ